MNQWKKTTTDLPGRRPVSSGATIGGHIRYFVQRALLNIRQNMFVNVVTISTIALAMLIVSIFLLLVVNLESASLKWSDRVQITTYFDKDLTPPEQDALKKKIVAIPGASRVTFVSKEQAFSNFKSRLKGQEKLLEGVSAAILPASFEISLRKTSRDMDGVEAFVSSLKQVEGITDVQYGEEWVRRFNTFLTIMRIMGFLLGMFLLTAVIFIVFNTIKLTVYSRRDELEVMALVGATRFFIKAPFLIEGVIQGALGALIAILALGGLYLLFLHNAGNFMVFNSFSATLMFLPPIYLAALLLGGISLGFVGSLASLKRFINL